jgi:hypothetical protein
MGKEFIYGQTIENMKESGNVIKCMAKEHLHGLMAESTSGNILKTKKKVTVNLFGLIIDAIEENG